MTTPPMSTTDPPRRSRRRLLAATLAIAACLLLAVPVAGRTLWSSGAGAEALPADAVNGQLLRLYRTALQRQPDGAGLAHWAAARQQGAGIEAVAAAIMGSAEFQHRLGAVADDQFVDGLYASVLNRAPDPAGRDHWIAQVGAVGRLAVLVAFSDSPEHQQLTGTPPPPGDVAPVASAQRSAPAPGGQVLLSADFNAAPGRDFGSVTKQDMAAALGATTSCSEAGELSLTSGVLRVRFRPNDQGSRRSFCTATLPGGHDELWLSYRVAPEAGWVPVQGGKLAGLAGGAANTGGNSPQGGEGFSARNMWRSAGDLVQYTYHRNQPGRYGEDFRYRADGAPVTLTPGQWRTVVHHVRLNTPGQRDGSIRAFVDGRLVLEQGGLELRGAGHSFSIDKVMVGGFYGGNSRSWAPPHTTYLQFDDVVVSTGPLA